LTGRETSPSNTDTLSGPVSLDASVLIELLSGTPLSKTITATIEDDTIIPYTSRIALTEAEYILCRKQGLDKARDRLEKLIQSRVIEIVEDDQLFLEAAKTKCARSIALGDCFTLALAEKIRGAALFTRQEDDLEVEMLRKPFSQKIHFLEPRPEINPDDPIFKNIERASKPGKKTKSSVDHDKALYRKP